MGTSADALSGMSAPPGAGNVPMDVEVSREAARGGPDRKVVIASISRLEENGMRRCLASLAVSAALASSVGLFGSVAAASNGALRVEWDGFVTSVDDVPVSVPVSCVTVVTPSGNANQFCHGTTENPTGGVVKFSGESTGRICVPEFPTGGGTPSLKWSEVITPSGQVSFTCRL